MLKKRKKNKMKVKNPFVDSCNETSIKCHEINEYLKKIADQCSSKNPNAHECSLFLKNIQNAAQILQQCSDNCNEHLKTCTERKCGKSTKDTQKKCEELLSALQECARLCKTPDQDCKKLCLNTIKISEECIMCCNQCLQDLCDLKAARESKIINKTRTTLSNFFSKLYKDPFFLNSFFKFLQTCKINNAVRISRTPNMHFLFQSSVLCILKVDA